jgi:putative Mn2+ efflux pump MntP/ribosomal protein S27E
MSTEHSSRSAIVISTIKGKIASIFGYTLTIPIGLTFIVSPFPDAESNIFALILMGLGAWLIYYGIKTKKRLRRFKKYIQIITTENTTSLESIARQTSQSLDFVTKDIQKMIYNKYFLNAYIDEKANEIVLRKRDNIVANVQVESNTSIEMISVNCKGCGAAKVVQKGLSSECEFCGSTLVAI